MVKSSYSNRKYIIIAIFVITGIIYLTRLFYLQVVDDTYALSADINVLRNITQYPARGLVYDKNGKLLVYNEAAYDLMVTPGQVQDFDTLELSTLIGIDVETCSERLRKAGKYSSYKSSVFEKQISKESFGYLEEKLYKYPGFFVQPRTLRKYSFPNAAHLLGYVGEVNQRMIDENPYYKSGDYIGISGIESSYEKELRGRKGSKLVMVDVHNREKGSYQNGKYDTIAVMGRDLYTYLDADLQVYGEKLMHNKQGSIVAIDPSTGGILTLISSPGYDPNLLVGRVRAANFKALQVDTLKPLFNRALMAQYPPGSTFKPVNALIGLEEEVVFPNTRYSCNMGYYAGNLRVGCHDHFSPLNLVQSIQHSCNAYYCNVFRSILDKKEFGKTSKGYNVWRDHVMSLGFNQKFDTDIPNELSGFIPETSYYDKYYGKDKWRSLTVVSMAIGQGEVLATPLQLANFSAVVANRGFYYRPHIIKAIGEPDNYIRKFNKRNYTEIDSRHYELVAEGMHDVVEAGTARWFKIDSIPFCGKTGTVENPHGKDHSVFIAFAPKENPKIAICVIVENAGFGSTWAAPISSLMIEKYLKGYIKRKYLEENILNKDLMSEN